MANSLDKLNLSGDKQVSRKHYCPTHDVLLSKVMRMPKRKMVYICPKGCEMARGTAVLR